MYGGNESKFLDDIIQTSEKRSKFDVVSVGLVASTNLNGNKSSYFRVKLKGIKFELLKLNQN